MPLPKKNARNLTHTTWSRYFLISIFSFCIQKKVKKSSQLLQKCAPPPLGYQKMQQKKIEQKKVKHLTLNQEFKLKTNSTWIHYKYWIITTFLTIIFPMPTPYPPYHLLRQKRPWTLAFFAFNIFLLLTKK